MGRSLRSVLLRNTGNLNPISNNYTAVGFDDSRFITRDDEGNDRTIARTGATGAAPVYAVASSGTLTSDATAPSDGDTVTIGGQVYTFKTALTASTTANEVLIGASAAAALDNLKAAVNDAGGTPGTDYGSDTVANASVTATTNTDTTQLFVAITPGVVGDDIATTETSAHLSWGAATLEGGQDATVAHAGDMLVDSGYLYVAYDDVVITETSAGWKRIALSALA